MKKETEIGTFELVLGEYGGDFIGKKSIHLFSRNYEIQVRFNVYDEGEEGLTEEMVKAAKACLDMFTGSTDNIEAKIKEYYEMEVAPISEEGDEDIENSVFRLAQMMRPKELYVTSFKAGLYFECDWDEEKGVGIKFDREGNIIRIGIGDIMY